MTNSTTTRPRSGVFAALGRWTAPPAGIVDPEERRRSRMVRSVAIGLAILLTVSGIVSSITTSLFPDRDTSLGWGATLIVLAAGGSFWLAFWLSGHRRNRLGAWATIFTIDAFLLGLGPFFPEVSASLALGFAVPVVCATLILDIRGTLVVFVVSFLLTAISLTIIDSSLVESAFIVGIMIAVTTMAVLVAHLREDDLLKARQLRALEQRNADRLKGELELAQKVQRAMLPSELPAVEGLQIAVYSEAAFEASGDFYDAFSLNDDDRIGIVVCDVAGKGVASALVMSATRASLRAEAQRTPSPALALARVNATLSSSIPTGLFVTIFYGVFEPSSRRLTFASAGHPHPFRGSTSGGPVTELESHGLPLGLLAEAEYEEQATVLEPGEYVFIYTDGLVEALDGDRAMYGFDAVQNRLALDGVGSPGAEALLEAALVGMRDFIGGESLQDDVTIVTLCLGDAAPVGAERADTYDGAREPAWIPER